MRNITGFYRQSALANNNPNVVATFGEIERQAMTYTVEDRAYKFAEYPNTDLVTFQVIDEYDQVIQTTEAVMRRVTAVGEWLFKQHSTGNIPADSLRDNFYASLRTEFADLHWSSMGTLLRSAENGNFMPTHVEFVIDDSGYEYNTKIWLANKNLMEEYGPFKLYIIPPVDKLDQFINNSVAVAGVIAEFSAKKTIDRYNTIRERNPNTRLDTYSLTWHDPDDSESTLVTHWVYVGYGIASTNIENIKTAIRDLLASQSTYTNWPAIFPSLYEENDFTIIPRWDCIAVPETQLDQNLYGSYGSIKDITTLANKLVPSSYGTAANINKHIQENLETFATFYRGMMLLVVANPSNQNKMVKLSLVYPDYSAVPPSADFERMEEVTRTFAETLNIGLEHARTFRDNDSPPDGFYRVSRNNKVYIAFAYNDYQYMILTRESFNLQTEVPK